MMSCMTRYLAMSIGVAITALLASAAHAQPPPTLNELADWHQRIVRTRGVVSIADGQAAQQAIRGWNLDFGGLPPAQRAQLAELELYAALAVGDVQRAQTWLDLLEGQTEDERRLLQAGWMVAVAAGRADLAQRTLDRLSRSGLAPASAVQQRAERLDAIGRPAPERKLATDHGPVALRDRAGVVLLLDLWSQNDPPREKQATALCDLYAELQSASAGTLLGVNTDAAKDLPAAQELASKLKYVWPQHYTVQDSVKPPLPEALHVGAKPVQVIIGQFGNVRAVGTARQVAFQYALRGALAEARGEHVAVLPRTTDGAVAPRFIPHAPQAHAQKLKEDKPSARAELPSNPEARALLERARLYLKTGKKTEGRRLLKEVAEKYPNTREGREARERLGDI